jgi:mono/diheme cytochrome c family protein
MTRFVGLACAIVLTACRASSPGPPPPLFDCRVAVEPLLAKLKASGGDPGRILRPRSSADLLSLTSGKRYKFATLRDGRLAIAPLPADAEANEYVHPVLSGGAPVRTAGGLRVDHDGSSLRKVTVDQDSRAYCPTAASLSAALIELARMGVPEEIVRVENRPPACGATPAPESGPRYVELMSEVGRRFEFAGRSMRAGRLALAAYELEELQEIFDDDLPKAAPPRVTGGADLPGVAAAFRQTNLPELLAAVRARDARAFGAAYARAAETCNGCHRASGHEFIEVPTLPGAAVPRLDPLR